jgi:hypothetical protein
MGSPVPSVDRGARADGPLVNSRRNQHAMEARKPRLCHPSRCVGDQHAGACRRVQGWLHPAVPGLQEFLHRGACLLGDLLRHLPGLPLQQLRFLLVTTAASALRTAAGAEGLTWNLIGVRELGRWRLLRLLGTVEGMLSANRRDPQNLASPCAGGGPRLPLRSPRSEQRRAAVVPPPGDVSSRAKEKG